MKPFVLFVTLIFSAGWLVAGQALGAGQVDHNPTILADATTPYSQSQMKTAVVPLNQDQIRHMQQILKSNGYDVGNVDGIIGPRTISALKDFQSGQALAVTGQPDEATLRALAPSAKEQEFFGLSPAYTMNVVPLNQDQIRHMQQILKHNGYDVGNEDGVIGPQTTSALKDFQLGKALTVTGKPDVETLKALAPSPKEQEYFGLSPAFGGKTPSPHQ